MQVEMKVGWIVPTHAIVEDEEERWKRLFLVYPKLGRGKKEVPHRVFSLLGEVRDEMVGVKLCSPGPQFLHFLEVSLGLDLFPSILC